MSGDLDLRGSEQLRELAARIKETGNKPLRNELTKGLRAATEPMRSDITAAASDRLPRRGGLGALVASYKVTHSLRQSGRNPGVRITMKGGKQLPLVDAGRVRHPVFGDRKRWVTQAIAPGFWSDPIDAASAKAAQEIQNVLDAVERKLMH